MVTCHKDKGDHEDKYYKNFSISPIIATARAPIKSFRQVSKKAL